MMVSDENPPTARKRTRIKVQIPTAEVKVFSEAENQADEPIVALEEHIDGVNSSGVLEDTDLQLIETGKFFLVQLVWTLSIVCVVMSLSLD